MIMDAAAALARWQQAWAGLGAPRADEGLLGKLVTCYGEPHRSYHTMHHLAECFEKLDGIRSDAVNPPEIEIALWFHDAIYDTKRGDNEAKSAEWARAGVLAAGVPGEVAGRVYGLVMVTRHDAVPAQTDERILVDVDLSILGAEPARFDEYERQVREEYSWVPSLVFRPRRRAILEAFLARPRIYGTRQFFDAYETRARANLTRSIRNLGH